MRAEAGAKFLAAAVGVALCVCIYVDVSDAAAETYAVPLTGTDIRLVSAPAEDLGQLALDEELSIARNGRSLLSGANDYGSLWLLYRKLFPIPDSPSSPTPEKIRIIKKLYGCHDDDDDARFCAILNERLFLALDELDFKIGREYDLDDD